MTINFKKFCLSSLLIMLASCGWQLKDPKSMSPHLDQIHLVSEEPNGQLLSELTRALEAYDIEAVGGDSKPDYSVVITDYRRIRRTSSMNNDARVAEYQLNEEVDFMVVDRSNNIVLKPSTASVERVYEFLETDVLASSNEERMVKRDMRMEIVRQIINRLSVLPSPNRK